MSEQAGGLIEARQANEHHEEVVHENTLFAEPIFHLGNFPITNSLVNSWLVVIIIVIFSIYLKKKVNLVPRGLQNAFEAVIDYFLDIFDSITGSRDKSLKFFPFVFTFFIFILLSNWMGLLPGIGSIGQVALEHGEKVFVPYLRGGDSRLECNISIGHYSRCSKPHYGRFSDRYLEPHK